MSRYLVVINNGGTGVSIKTGDRTLVSFYYTNTITVTNIRVTITRLGGATADEDKNADPNKPADIPAIQQEPYGPIDTRGAKPPRSPINGYRDQDPNETKPLPKGTNPSIKFPPIIWNGPIIKDPGVPFPDDYTGELKGKKGGSQTPQPAFRRLTQGTG